MTHARTLRVPPDRALIYVEVDDTEDPPPAPEDDDEPQSTTRHRIHTAFVVYMIASAAIMTAALATTLGCSASHACGDTVRTAAVVASLAACVNTNVCLLGYLCCVL